MPEAEGPSWIQRHRRRMTSMDVTALDAGILYWRHGSSRTCGSVETLCRPNPVDGRPIPPVRKSLLKWNLSFREKLSSRHLRLSHPSRWYWSSLLRCRKPCLPVHADRITES